MVYNMTNVARMREYPAALRMFEKTIKFTQQNAAAGDVFQVIPVLAGDVLLMAWAEVVTACTTGSTIDLGYGTVVDYYGNGLAADTVGKCSTILSTTLTVRDYDIEDKSEATEEVEIEGARFGDIVIATPNRFFADLAITGDVVADDSVAIHMVNNTGGGLNLTDHTIGIQVHKAPKSVSPIVFTAGDTIDVTTNEAITTGVLKVSALVIRK